MGGSGPFAAIRYNLRHLLDFRGRDARRTFGYYMLFLVGVYYAIGAVVTFTVVGMVMRAAMDGASDQALQDMVSNRLGLLGGGVLWATIATDALLMALLPAAFVRRLHDAGRSGWWVLVPLTVLAAAIAITLANIELLQQIVDRGIGPGGMGHILEPRNDLAYFEKIGWIAPLVVVGLGLLKSTDGPNKYGAEPVRF